jgi:hypothetical protein
MDIVILGFLILLVIGVIVKAMMIAFKMGKGCFISVGVFLFVMILLFVLFLLS